MNLSRDVFYPESLKSQTLFENHKISPSLSTTKLCSQLHGSMPAGTQWGEQGSALQQLQGHTNLGSTGLTYWGGSVRSLTQSRKTEWHNPGWTKGTFAGSENKPAMDQCPGNKAHHQDNHQVEALTEKLLHLQAPCITLQATAATKAPHINKSLCFHSHPLGASKKGGRSQNLGEGSWWK